MNKVIIFAAPSGSGKSTIVRNLLENSDFELSVSATTREPREYEEEGIHYDFMSVEEFKEKIEENSFIEWEEVYTNQFYGTLKQRVKGIWNRNKIVLFDVDVQGAMYLKEYFGDKALSVFIKVPSIEILTKRLYIRGSETEESLAKRISKFEEELTWMPKFDYLLVNDNLEETMKTLNEKLDEWI